MKFRCIPSTTASTCGAPFDIVTGMRETPDSPKSRRIRGGANVAADTQRGTSTERTVARHVPFWVELQTIVVGTPNSPTVR